MAPLADMGNPGMAIPLSQPLQISTSDTEIGIEKTIDRKGNQE